MMKKTTFFEYEMSLIQRKINQLEDMICDSDSIVFIFFASCEIDSLYAEIDRLMNEQHTAS